MAQPLESILRAEPKNRVAKNEMDTVDLEVGFDFITGTVVKESSDELDVLNVPSKGKRQKAQKDTSDHSILRPRVVESVLKGQKVGKSPRLKSMTGDEFKQYVEAFGGRPLKSATDSCQIVVVGPDGLTETVRRQLMKAFVKIMDEDAFFSWLVQDSISVLEKVYNLNKKLYPHITQPSDIQKVVQGIPWVGWDECREPLTLREVDRMLAMESGDKCEKKKKMNTLDGFLKKQHENEGDAASSTTPSIGTATAEVGVVAEVASPEPPRPSEPKKVDPKLTLPF